jgi:hydrogenase large subunit
MELEWNVPEKSNAIERDRARTYQQAYSALVGLHCLERAFTEVRAGRTKSWQDFKVPDDAVSVGFHEAARGVLSHHMVIEGGKIANYQPYPPTPWNAPVRRPVAAITGGDDRRFAGGAAADAPGPCRAS